MSRYTDIEQVPEGMLPQAMPLPPEAGHDMHDSLPGLGGGQPPLPSAPPAAQPGGEQAGQMVALMGSMQQTLLAILRTLDKMAN